jgi:hypothetical protein
MNRFYVAILSLTIFLFPCLSYAGETSLPNPYVISYPFKSAIIHYDMKNEYGHGKVSEGTQTVYIKGDKLAKITKGALPDSNGEVKQTENLWLFTPDYVYEVDLITKTGTKIDNPKKYTKPAYDNLSTEERKAFHNRMEKRRIISIDLLGLEEKIGTESILGHECDIYQSGKELTPENLSEALEGGAGSFYVKSSIWRTAKIPLKIKTSGLGGSNELIATKVEEDLKIPEKIFTVPPGIKITYDKEKSEFEKREALARFELYKTGKPMVVKMKLEKRIMKKPGDSMASEPNKKGKEN